MKKIVTTAMLVLIVTTMVIGIVAADPFGPAPNAGDGIPDGSGF